MPSPSLTPQEFVAKWRGDTRKERSVAQEHFVDPCFETFPWPPGAEPKDDPRVLAIADAARELVEKRDRWLNTPGAAL